MGSVNDRSDGVANFWIVIAPQIAPGRMAARLQGRLDHGVGRLDALRVFELT
jgi:hypothetical protein